MAQSEKHKLFPIQVWPCICSWIFEPHFAAFM